MFNYELEATASVCSYA